MAFGAKVKLALDSGSASKLAGEIQKAVDSAAKQNFTIKINKIDASGAISDLRSQLTTMLSGLKISGVKEFLGTEGVGEAYKAAQKAAEAQVNARANVLKTLQSSVDSTFKRGNNITDASAVEHITQEYTELCSQIERAKTLEGDALRDATTQINQKRAALMEYINAQIQAARQTNQSNQQEIASMKQIASLYKQLTNYADKNPRVMKNDVLGSELQGYINELQSAANGTITLSSGRLKEIGNGFASISERAREARLEGKSLGDVIAGAYQKFGGWMLVTQSLTKAIHTIKQMINTVKELDTAMTELRKVSDLTDLGYDQVFDKAIERAKTYGATVSDTITATADFSRLGYGIEDATKLADASIVYKNVGDGIENITEASESIISTMKAFGIEATDSMQIVDKFNEVGNHFAISSKGIGDALQRSASALAAAGNTIDESIGLAVGMNTVLQNPEKVGRLCPTL